MNMSGKTYDVLKYIAQIVLPGLGTLYFALASIWGLPYGEQVVGTITAIDAFLGVLLGISSDRYYAEGRDTDGVLMIDTHGDEEKWLLQMKPEINEEEIQGKHSIKLSVDMDADLSGNENADYLTKH